MCNIKKIFIILLSISLPTLQMPSAAYAKFYLSAGKPTEVSKNPPQIIATPEEEISVVAAPITKEKKSNKEIIWYIAGIVARIGVFTAVAGGGGYGNGPNDTGEADTFR